MKLIFSKGSDSDISVKIQQGTILVDFTYIEMISQLLRDGGSIECDYENLSEAEIDSIKAMVDKISTVFE